MQPYVSRNISVTATEDTTVAMLQDVQGTLEHWRRESVGSTYGANLSTCYSDGAEDDEDNNKVLNPALLSQVAVRLRDKVPRYTHARWGMPYESTFTGHDIVSTIQDQIYPALHLTHGLASNDRRAALRLARNLHSRLFYYEVEWSRHVLQDAAGDVYAGMFLSIIEDDGAEPSTGGVRVGPQGTPTGVITPLTRCFSVTCDSTNKCYSYSCPRKFGNTLSLINMPHTEEREEDSEVYNRPTDTGKTLQLEFLPQRECNRQRAIGYVISWERQYLRSLDLLESLFIRPLQSGTSQIIRPSDLEEFIEATFGNILSLRECHRRLMKTMDFRQREQAPIVKEFGDILFNMAAEFQTLYPTYISNIPLVEKKLKGETEENVDFGKFLAQRIFHSDASGRNLKRLLNLPSEHLQEYSHMIESILQETAEGDPDINSLKEAMKSIKKAQTLAHLCLFQTAMNQGPSSKLDWHNLVEEEARMAIPKKEAKRQMIIFELIKGEMDYVTDLENIELIFVQPLREMDPPIIPRDRLAPFIHDVFRNLGEIRMHHCKMLKVLHKIQREEHPCIRSIATAVYDAVLDFRGEYMKYIVNYPIAAYRIDDESANNAVFKQFVEQCTRHPSARRLDMKALINRPIPRVLRYELLLQSILDSDETPEKHGDMDTIPRVIEILRALRRSSEEGITIAKQHVEVWQHKSLSPTTPIYAEEWTGLAMDIYMLSLLTYLFKSATLSETSSDQIADLRTIYASASPFDACVEYSSLHGTGPGSLCDLVLCTMQNMHDQLPNGKAKHRRAMMKYSQAVGAVPSTLFVHNVKCTDSSAPSGMGGFSDVFQGTLGERAVALKRLRRSDPSWKRSFLREGVMWYQLRHPCILEFLGLDEDSFQGYVCMVSPWMSNGDLAKYLATHHDIDVQQKRKWIHNVVDGLAYLHDEGVVHGDLRGANILLDDDLQGCITDFGLSMLTDAGLSTMGVSVRREGAVRWMAPEVLETGECTTEGDIYSFGCVCLEIVTGRCPLPDLRNERQVTSQVLRQGRRPEWPQGDSELSGSTLADVVQTCWKDNPTSRPDMHGVKTQLYEHAPAIALNRRESVVVVPQEILVEAVNGGQRSYRRSFKKLGAFFSSTLGLD